ncbi:photosynthetic reaction center subunit H [Alkalicaulis satelles]|uniref:Photosynthetic reaction center subunit H n=1 Tax=Alkalicaulis satelles TaxID=2609175 RepID=A0A5M6ZK29_9PROT|nr:photosynthetic reaction center subunit H [Alkalicaulis satelles]KAA5804027.1 photosynthetic reaction center subunit H [Alkalicaulis satelles]
MSDGAIIGSLDLTTLLFMAFTLFFIGLVFYLRREDRREGYPLEADTTGKLEEPGAVWFPTRKAFKLPSGETVFKPDMTRDAPSPNMERLAVWPGAPSQPVGDPMAAGVGPGAYAQREDKPDLTHENLPKIVPMRALPDFDVARPKIDPRGMTVIGADGESAGVISDIWVDRAEALVRYYEVELAKGGRKVLLPFAFTNIRGKARKALVSAIQASQFAGVPAHKSPDQVTRLEEEKISAYYGAGTLYATSDKAEPWF